MENLTDENYIGLICNGEFNAIPDFPIGELFESFFDDINYNVVKTEDEIFVDFTGSAICDEKPCTILIRFLVDKDATEFEINEVKVDEDILNEDEIFDLLEDIAYINGANLEDDEYWECDHTCGECNGHCGNNCDGECDENCECDDEESNNDNENNDEDDE